jgi:hydrogenase expression/formation protein HypC
MCLAVPGKIVSIEGQDPIMRAGRVNFGGIVKEVNLSYVPEAKVNDYVIVHVGFALSIVDEKEALQVFEYLKSMNELKELEGESVSWIDESKKPEERAR